MWQIIFKGALLGFSTGLFCLGYCLPILLPFLAKKDFSQSKVELKVISLFALGRFFGYLLFGALLGFLGLKLNNPLIHRLVAISIILLALYLLTFGLFKRVPEKRGCLYLDQLLCKKGTPVLLGFFTGLNVCPPFLLAISYTFELRQALTGLFFFGSFWIGTSLYLIPIGLLGQFSRYPQVRTIAGMANILVGFIFLGEGLLKLLPKFSP